MVIMKDFITRDTGIPAQKEHRTGGDMLKR